MSGNIIVIEPESRFKKIDKSLIENQNIDCLTLGIYTKIVSFGKKWNLNVKGLSTILGLSDKKIRKSIVLLEKEGYIVRTAAKNEKGQLCGWNYKIYPIPVNEKKRSNAGKTTKNESCRLTQKQTTRETDNTENGQDIYNKTKNTFKTKLNKKENKEKEMANSKNYEIKQYQQWYNSYINSEQFLFKLYQELQIDVHCIKSLLFIFTYKLNTNKESNAFQYIEHFKNWLNTDGGRKAINDIKKV